MANPEQPPPVSFRDALRVWVRVALLSFGGPAAQIAVMHRILVEEKRWISENRFLHALNYCMLLPGPEAQQLATYIGWLLHRSIGGLTAGLLFVLPGFLSILVLSILYACYQQLPLVDALFFGLKPAVMAVVIEALLKIGKRVLKNGVMYAIAATAFVAIFFFEVPFPLIVLGAGTIGFLGGKFRPGRFLVLALPSTSSDQEAVFTDHVVASARPSILRTAGTASLWLVIWLGPLAAIVAWAGPDNVFAEEGMFFSKTAVVTFGGAYAVLAYIAQQAVEVFAWLQPGEMLDGLGMAETTPGPLIQVVQFVGFMGAYRNPTPFEPLTAGVLGSIITTWMTFAPCFLWIFVGAPYIEYLRGRKLLTAALSAITAAVVGVILNLAVWFSLHTLFGEVTEQSWTGMRLLIPSIASIDLGAITIAIAACIAMFKYHVKMLPVLAGSMVIGIAWRLVIGS